MFKADDIVVCVCAECSPLTLGETYTVREADKNFVYLAGYIGLDGGFYNYRFKLKSEIMDNTDPTVEILQSEYDSLIDEINLLQELLAEQNAKLVAEEFKPLTEMAYGGCRFLFGGWR